MEEQQLNRVDEIINSKVKLNSEKEYREYDALNYSKLSKLASSPGLVNIKTEETPSMLLGSIVDNLLTQGNYGEEYTICPYEKPTGQMGQFCDQVIAMTLAGEAVELVDTYQEAYNA